MTKRIDRDNLFRIKPRGVRANLIRRFSQIKVGTMVGGQIANSYSQCAINTIRTTIGTNSISVKVLCTR